MKNSIKIVAQIFFSLATTAIFAINFLSGIVGGIWLLLAGGWALILQGIIMGIIMPYVFSIVSAPTFLIVPFAEKLKNNKIALAIVLFFASIFNYGPLLLWVNFVFYKFVSNNQFPFIALILAGYATVMSPLSYMTSHENEGGLGTTLGLLYAQLCYLFLVLGLLFQWNPSSVFWSEIWLALLFMLLSVFTLSTVKFEEDVSIDEDIFADPLVEEAITICFSYEKVSPALFQRALGIDYEKATEIFKELNRKRLIGNIRIEDQEDLMPIGKVSKRKLKKYEYLIKKVKEYKKYQYLNSSPNDPFLDQAKQYAYEFETIVPEDIQRKFKTGYARAAKILDQLELADIIVSVPGKRYRKVNKNPEIPY